MALPRSSKVPKSLSVASMEPRVTVPLEDWKKTYSSLPEPSLTLMGVPEPIEIPSPVGPAGEDMC